MLSAFVYNDFCFSAAIWSETERSFGASRDSSRDHHVLDCRFKANVRIENNLPGKFRGYLVFDVKDIHDFVKKPSFLA